MQTSTHTTTKPRQGILHNRNYLLLFFAYGVSALGDHLSEMAILKTQNALDPGVDVTPLDARMTFLFFIPFLILGPFAGMLADRLPRRGLMIVADLVRALILAQFAALIAWAQPWGTWGAFAPLLLVGLFAALFSPARASLLPTLVHREQLVRANALMSGLGIISTMIAAAIGGYLANHHPPQVAFRWNTATFVLSAILIFAIRTTPKSHDSGSGVAAGSNSLRRIGLGLRQGVQYLLTHRRLLELLAIAFLIWFCGSLVKCVIPAIARDKYHGDYQTISLYRALLGLGFILGAAFLSTIGSSLRGEVVVSWGMVGIALSIGLFGLSCFLPWAPSTCARVGAVGIVGGGFFAVAVLACLEALMQRSLANHFRGRVFGVRDVVTTIALLLATGALCLPRWNRLDAWVGYVLLAVSVIMIVAGVCSIVIRLRRGHLGPFWTFLEHLNEFVARIVWRFERVGNSTVPREGAVIVASNHVSGTDPMLLCAAAPYRPLVFMIAEEYARQPIVRWFVRWLGCIPVRKGSRNVESTHAAIEHLRQGKPLVMFLHGGIEEPGEPAMSKDGAAFLALQSGAPVIPAYISGVIHRESVLASIFTRHRARVRYGPAVDLSGLHKSGTKRDVLHEATARIEAAIQQLAKDSASGIREK